MFKKNIWESEKSPEILPPPENDNWHKREFLWVFFFLKTYPKYMHVIAAAV